MFFAIILVLIPVLYGAFLSTMLLPNIGWHAPGAVITCILFHFFFCNVLLALYQCKVTDPGGVPAEWCDVSADEERQRRYCKVCKVTKPERADHCGVCKRCVLSRDHHCDWVNNCIGFYNRKFFILLVIYSYATLVTMMVYTAAQFVNLALKSDKPQQVVPVTWKTPALTLMVVACLMLLITLTSFTRFHLKLLFDNFTTLEYTVREGDRRSKFDMGWRDNVKQVFGGNPCYWWLPVHVATSMPCGDGINWRDTLQFGDQYERLNPAVVERD